MVMVADKLCEIVKQFDPALELKFNKHYIGLGRDGTPFNFVTIRPKKATVTLEIKLPRTDDIDAKIEQAGLDTLEYNARWSYYRLRLTPADVTEKTDLLRELMRLAFDRRTS
jgi:predicted transport protein